MTIAWSLAQDLQNATNRKQTVYFAPPIAAAIDPTEPFELAQDLPGPNAYSIGEVYTDDEADADPAQHRTTEVALSITVAPMSYPVDSRFSVLPAGAFRLHAFCSGRLTVQLGSTTTLKLEMLEFATASVSAVPWWQRWVSAKRIPSVLLYENVDLDALSQVLDAIAASQTEIHGLSLPPLSSNVQPAEYVSRFLAGQDGYFLDAKASAFLGAAGASPSGTQDERQVTLKARYSDSTDETPSPMSPRELMYLAFGEASTFSQQHPLFQRMNQLKALRKRADNTLISMAGMLMRPPLRTSRRLIWEAEQETAIDDQLRNTQQAPHWGSKYPKKNPTVICRLGPDSLYDKKFRRYTRDNHSKGIAYGDLPGSVKCNVFVGDLCVRAGFRTLLHEIRVPNGYAWHTIDAGSFCNLARTSIAASATLQLTNVKMTGMGQRAAEWGFARSRMLTNAPSHDAGAIDAVNKLIAEEGRVLIVAGVRRREGPSKAAAACSPDLFKARAGHIVFMESLIDFTCAATNDPGGQDEPGIPANGQTIDSIHITSAQAQSTSSLQKLGGARVHHDYSFQLNGVANVAGDGRDFIRIHILEASPGGDPDLLHNQQDLHIKQVNTANLGTSLDRARPAQITGSTKCCQDNYPHGAAEGTC